MLLFSASLFLFRAVGVACTIAEGASINTGRNHIVARFIKRKGYVVYPSGHKALKSDKIILLYEIDPESGCLHLEQ